MDSIHHFHITNDISITMPNFISLINKYIDTSSISIIVDAGSMDGNDSEILHNAFPTSKVYAIEGLPDNYNRFILNKSNIIGIPYVIASYDGQITYYQKNINGIHGIYNRGNDYGSKTLELPCYKMSTIMNQYNISHIDVLKIDVEGATYDLLQSLENHISTVKIMHIETETYPFFEGQILHDTVCDFLIRHNFECVKISFCEIRYQQYQSDSVWVNKTYKK